MQAGVRGTVSYFLEEHECVVVQKNSWADEFYRQLPRFHRECGFENSEETRGILFGQVEVNLVMPCRLGIIRRRCLKIEFRLSCWDRLDAGLRMNDFQGCADDLWNLNLHFTAQDIKAGWTSAGGAKKNKNFYPEFIPSDWVAALTERCLEKKMFFIL